MEAREPGEVLVPEVAHRHREAVGGGVRRGERPGRAAERLQAQIRILQLDLPAVDRDELGRAPLLVLEPAVAHRRARIFRTARIRSTASNVDSFCLSMR